MSDYTPDSLMEMIDAIRRGEPMGLTNIYRQLRAHADALEENAKLAARVRELEADAARYRWLRNCPLPARIRVESFEFPRATWDCIHTEKLDAAIDAARRTK